MEKYYVYQYIDPRDNQIIYIGKGKGNRKFFHLNKAKCATELKEGQNRLFINTLRKILKENLEPKIEVVSDNLTEIEALNLEEFLITKYGRKLFDPAGTLLNILVGGSRGPEGLSEEHRLKISRAQAGRQFSKDHCENISKAKVGKACSIDHIAKLKVAAINSFKDPETKSKHARSTATSNKANFSKIWIIEDLISNTIIEISNMNEWVEAQGWDKNDGQQLYRTFGKPNKYIDSKYKSFGYRLLEKRNQSTHHQGDFS